MILKKLLLLPLFLTSCLFSFSGFADTMDMKSVGDQATNISRPRHGTSMDSVLRRFGEPGSRLPAVGQPPITRWNYADFTVYFEYQHVIHSVVHR